MSPPPSNAVPPNADHAEDAIVGALLVSASVLPDVTAILGPEHFRSPRARHVYEAFLSLTEAGRRADDVIVLERLEREYRPPAGGWEPYLCSCAERVPSAAGAADYARLVRDSAARRFLANLGAELQHGASALDLDALVSSTIERLATLDAAAHVRPVKSAEAAVHELQEVMRKEDHGLPTGFAAVDDVVGGLRPGDLAVLAARPSMGKSTFAQNVAEHVAASGLPVLFFSLEMPAHAIVARMVCTGTGLPLARVLTGALSETEADEAADRMFAITRLPLHFCDRSVLGLGDVLSECRRVQAVHGLALVVVDYLQLMKTERAERHEREIGQLSSGLKRLAGDLDVPVLCLAQLNRDLEKRADKTPRLSDLRDSGSIEQDADLVLMLYREWIYDTSAGPERADVFIRKHRNGPTGSVALRFLGGEFRFAEALR